MKYIFLVFTGFFLQNVVIAQSYPDAKRNNIWLFGYGGGDFDTLFSNTKMDFNFLSPQITRHSFHVGFDHATSIMCDTSGNLLVYSNNLKIYNKENEIMQNGNINPQPVQNDRIVQGNIMLPLPGSDHIYYLFHEEYSYIDSLVKVKNFYYSIIDMNENNGLGKVLSVNNLLIEDTVQIGSLTATKHANGRDWWIIVPESDSDAYYKVLFTSGGPILYDKQSVGIPVPFSLGQSVFSPDGHTYARVSYPEFEAPVLLDVYDFDRCSGEMSNHRHIENFPDGGTGVAISPNSRFLYITVSTIIIQYDLWASDLASSGIVIAEYDGFQSPYPTTFWLMQLGPDNKIYANCTTPATVLHVINHPDSAGVACQVEQHGVQLLTYNQYTMPNAPYYDLYALDGSPCDTLNIDSTGIVATREVPVYPEVLVFPNPASDKLYIEIAGSGAELEISDLSGRTTLRQSLQNGMNTIDIGILPEGLYLYVVKSMQGAVWRNGKVVKFGY